MLTQESSKEKQREGTKSKGASEPAQDDTSTSTSHILRAMSSHECATLSTSQTSPNDASNSLENKYYYSPLPRLGTIRLLCLLPHKDQIAPIECQLFDYRLQEPDRETHLYDALSYV